MQNQSLPRDFQPSSIVAHIYALSRMVVKVGLNQGPNNLKYPNFIHYTHNFDNTHNSDKSNNSDDLHHLFTINLKRVELLTTRALK